MTIPILALSAALAAAAAAQALPAPGALEWEVVHRDGQGEYALAPASLARDGDRVTLLVRGVLAQAGADGTRIVVGRVTIDCAGRTDTLEAGDYYRADGSWHHSRDVPPADRFAQPIGDAAPGRTELLRRVCERR